MARGAAGKLRRRNRKKEDQETADQLFGGGSDSEDEGGDDRNGTHDFGPADIPLPPGMSAADEGGEESLLPEKKKKKSKNTSTGRTDDDENVIPGVKKSGSKTGGGLGGIKGTPLILLILMTGTTLLPAIIYASDIIGNWMQNHHVVGQLGFRLGMGAVPRKRVLSFYEKHDPTKLEDVPKILSKHYGDYPTLIKKLERKYQDYGYFLEWEQDEAPLALAMEQLQETYAVWIHSYWNVYAPQPVKTAARNIRYNLTYLHKKFHKVWKKTIWPMLEPIFGVPKGTAAQKRQDAAEARKRKRATGGSKTKRKNQDFRDDVDEE
jgi:hypothetical protein